MNPSNPNHHRQPTSLVTGAGHYRQSIEAQNTLGHQYIRSHYPAAYRVADIAADNQTRTAADPRTQTSTTLIYTRGDGAHQFESSRVSEPRE